VLPLFLEAIERESGGGHHRVLEPDPGPQPFEQGLEGAGGITPGQVEHGGDRQSISHAGRIGVVSEESIQLPQLGKSHAHHCEVEPQFFQPVPLPARPRRIPLVEPEGQPSRYCVMENQVGDLVMQGLDGGWEVGAENNGTGLEESEPSAPARALPVGESGHLGGVGNQDQTKAGRGTGAQTGPGREAVGFLCELNGRGEAGGIGNDGYRTNLGLPRELQREEPGDDDAQAVPLRGGSPPPSTTSSISLHRLPQGLNLLAL